MKLRFVLVLASVLITYFASAQQKYRSGLKFSEFEYSKVPKRYFSVRGTRTMPQQYSLKQYCPKPLSQLDLPTSAGWAVSYSAFTIIKAEQNNWTGDEITRNAAAPLYPYFKALSDPSNTEEEVTLLSVIDALKKYGTPSYMELPSRGAHPISHELVAKASENRISEYARLYDKYDPASKKITAIKATLNENLPVIVSMHIANSFFYAKEFWKPREAFSKDLPGHALTVVGYDDSKYGGAFEVMNSWGTGWGNEGFMWIPYEYFTEFVTEAYDIYVIPGASSGTELGGGIDLTLVEGKSPMEIIQLSPGYYKIAKSYPSGTQFTIKINNESPAFIYAFGSDLTEEIWPFFPPTYTSAALSKATSFYVPDANTPLEIYGEAGTDYLCVLFSKEDLNIIDIHEKMMRTKGDFKHKITTALGDNLIDPAEITFESNQVKFKMKKSDKAVVMLVVEHEHK
ncbi:MAG: C1 family peptidase [Bacteroidota bacterium]